MRVVNCIKQIIIFAKMTQPINLAQMYINEFLLHVRTVTPITIMVNENAPASELQIQEQIEEIWEEEWRNVEHHSRPLHTFMCIATVSPTKVSVKPEVMRLATIQNKENIRRVFYDKTRYIIENTSLAYDALEVHYQQEQEIRQEYLLDLQWSEIMFDLASDSEE